MELGPSGKNLLNQRESVKQVYNVIKCMFLKHQSGAHRKKDWEEGESQGRRPVKRLME